MNPRVSIIIVNWNGKDDTLVALKSIKTLRTSGVNLSVIVVDNGSTNDSVSVIRSSHPWANLVILKKNLGFTGGNNVGMKTALRNGTDIIWLLNNDTIVHKDALSMAQKLSGRVGIAGSKIYFAPGKEYHKERYTKDERGRVFWYAGGLIDWNNMYASHRGVDEVDHGQYDIQDTTEFVTGCSMMIRADVIDRIGLLDDKFYLYLEDLDYCLRAKRAGFSLMYVPSSIVWHVNAGSSGGAGNPLHDYYLTRNRLLIASRYAPIRTRIALLRESVRFIAHGPDVKRKAVLDAMLCRFGNQYEPKKY